MCLQQIKLLISEKTGLRILDDKSNSFLSLIECRKKAYRLTSNTEYLHLIQNFSSSQLVDEYQHLCRGLTTGETYFFRDHGQIELLSQHILPELIEHNRAKRCLRIWSAGCSSGEEPYSLAILLDELAEDLSGWQVTILGTDIDPGALAKARQGHYTEWSFRQVSELRRRRYFSEKHKQWLLHSRIRNSVQFCPLNLVTDIFPSSRYGIEQIDLILCRNVFIYLESNRVSQIADKMTASLVEGGYLMTGHGELYAHHLGGLRTRVFPGSIVYQKHRVAEHPRVTETVANVEANIKPVITNKIIAQHSKPKPIKSLKADQKQPSPTLQEAWNFANQGKSEQARAYCVQLIAQNSFDHQPYYLTALLDQESGKHEEAKFLLKKVLYLAPDFISAYLELGDIYAKENAPALAQKMWLSARDLLQKLAPDKPVEMFGDSTAQDILQFIETRLNTSY